MKFSERLRELRKSKGYTQEYLAKTIGITPAAIGLYEQDRREPDNDTLIALAEVFSVSVDCLLGLDEPYSIQNKTRLTHSLGVANFASQLKSSLIIAYNGENTLKKEIVKSIENVLNNIEDEQKLSQIKMFLDTYKK